MYAYHQIAFRGLPLALRLSEGLRRTQRALVAQRFVTLALSAKRPDELLDCLHGHVPTRLDGKRLDNLQLRRVL